MDTPRQSARARVEGHTLWALSDGWQAARAPEPVPDASSLESLGWIAARVPGTAAAALCDAGLWRPGEPYDFDAEDWWFRTSFACEPAEPGEQLVLALDGIATVADVYLNGELVLHSDSMFASHALDVGARVRADANELAICCRALAPLLRERRRPRARWRTRLVADGNLRFFRTMLLGRAPGFAPGPAAVGPWRAVGLQRRRRVVVEELTLRPRVDGEDGVLSVRTRLRALAGTTLGSIELELTGPSGTHRAALAPAPDAEDTDADGLAAAGELRVPAVARWWPHTHGEPVLHEVRLLLACGQEPLVIDAGRVGFRELAPGPGADHAPERDGLDVHVNGVRVFARGAVWTPVDAIALAPDERELRHELCRARDAGMNMLRVPGTGAYESAAFHDLCDELGILVWQDLMFANLDYPLADDAFRASVEREAAEVLDAIGGRPSLAVVCGNSEIEQQVAMLGLDPSLGRGELFGELLPGMLRDREVDAAYVPSAPCGGERPFRPDRGIANYYGVGGYRRPLQDARLAGVRFAAECLAFSNVPEPQTIELMHPRAPGQLVVHHPAWKAGVPRDAGAGWDFEDVRDHYLELLYGLDARELRRVDHERYLELSRQLSGEVMAEVFGEWRRAGSPCGGALVLWLRDLLPGAGWGVIDNRGEPKAAYHHLRRALAPIAVWSTDEGLAGVGVHIANDRPLPLSARLRVALYQDFERCVGEAREAVELAAHECRTVDLESVLGHFVDASWAYRFGPPAQDAIVLSLEADEREHGGARLLSQAVRFPEGPPIAVRSAEQLGLSAHAYSLEGRQTHVTLSCRRLAWGVRMRVPGFIPDDDAFTLEPGRPRTIAVRARDAHSDFDGGAITALNLHGRVAIEAGRAR